MLRSVLFCLVCASSLSHAADRFQVGDESIEIGDHADHLLATAGSPSHKYPVYTNRPGFWGQRWEYRQHGTPVDISVGGNSVQIIADGTATADASLADVKR